MSRAKRIASRAALATATALVASAGVAAEAHAVDRPGPWSEVTTADSSVCDRPVIIIAPYTKDVRTDRWETPERLGRWFLVRETNNGINWGTSQYQQFGVKEARVTVTCNSPRPGQATYTYTPTLYTYRTKLNSKFCYGLSCQPVPGRPSPWR